MGRDRKPRADPRGHSLRVYADIYDSAAWRALSPHDVLAYLALLRELKGYNNGNLSLPLTRAKQCGIKHHITLARSLRALCAVGLVALTRKGGSTRGGQRLPSLYRLTDRDCYEVPKLGLEAVPASDEWKKVQSIDHGAALIAQAEAAAKKISLGHPVTVTTSPNDMVKAKTRTRRDTWDDGPGHAVTMAENGANPMLARVSGGFEAALEKPSHRTPDVSPLYIYQSQGLMDDDMTATASQQKTCETMVDLWKALAPNKSRLWHVGPRGPAMGIGALTNCACPT